MQNGARDCCPIGFAFFIQGRVILLHNLVPLFSLLLKPMTSKKLRKDGMPKEEKRKGKKKRKKETVVQEDNKAEPKSSEL